MSRTQGETDKYRRAPDSPSLVIAAAGALGAFAAIVLVEHLLTPSLDPLEHQISEYAHAGTGPLMTLGFVLWAVSLLASAILVERRWGNQLLATLLIAASLGMAVTTIFPTQTSAGELPPGMELTTTGKLHNLGSGLASLALVAGAGAVALSPDSDGRLRRDTIVLLAAGLLLSVVLLSIGPSVGGLRQRLLLSIALWWQILLLRDLSGRAT